MATLSGVMPAHSEQRAPFGIYVACYSRALAGDGGSRFSYARNFDYHHNYENALTREIVRTVVRSPATPRRHVRHHAGKYHRRGQIYEE